jgi:hypothetical protein
MAILEKLTPVSRYSALRVVESADGTHWCHMHADLVDNPGRACFKPNLVNEIIQYQWTLGDRMRRTRGNEAGTLQHVVLASDCDAFNLGGDLEYFCDSIRRQDRHALLTYARRCVRGVHAIPHRAGCGTRTASRWSRATRWAAAWRGRVEPATPSSPRKAWAWACRRSCSTCSRAWVRTRSCASASPRTRRRS